MRILKLNKLRKAILAKSTNPKKDIREFEDILSSGKLIEATIIVHWKNSRLYGANPKATMEGVKLDNNGKRDWFVHTSKAISGCGFDKLSTALAEVINQEKSITKELYRVKNNFINAHNRNVFGYGSGYGLLPYFERGVGVNCFTGVFDKIGYKIFQIAKDDMLDIFKIVKK